MFRTCVLPHVEVVMKSLRQGVLIVCPHPACVRLAHVTAAQTFFDALLESTGLKDTLRNGDGNYTILAPHNSAWSQALIQNTLDCTTDFYITSECNDIQNLLTATNLKDILLSHSETSQLMRALTLARTVPVAWALS